MSFNLKSLIETIAHSTEGSDTIGTVELNANVSGGGLSPHNDHSQFSIEVQSPTSSRVGIYRIFTLRNVSLCRRHLLWHLLYRGISVDEFLILFREYERLLGMPEKFNEKILFTGFLFEAGSTRKGLLSFNSSSKPIQKILGKARGFTITPDKREYLLHQSHLHLKIPQKGLPTKDLYTLRRVNVLYKSPKPKQYMGIGYNDQGSRSDQMSWQEQNIPENYVQHIPLPEVELLLEQWDRLLKRDL